MLHLQVVEVGIERRAARPCTDARLDSSGVSDLCCSLGRLVFLQLSAVTCEDLSLQHWGLRMQRLLSWSAGGLPADGLGILALQLVCCVLSIPFCALVERLGRFLLLERGLLLLQWPDVGAGQMAGGSSKQWLRLVPEVISHSLSSHHSFRLLYEL